MDLDLRQLADFGKVLFLDPAERQRVRAFGRQAQIDQLARRLSGPQRGSVLLLGPSGVGKTAVIYELARQAAEWDEPLVFLETASAQMLAGTTWLGERQTRVKNLVEQARFPRRLVLFFTDIGNLPTTGTTVHSNDSVGTFLAPFIESGELLVCGECTSEQYRIGLESDPKFAKLFEVHRLEAADRPETLEILTSLAGQWERSVAERPSPAVSVRALEAVIELSEDYFPGQAFPGKAARLLDRVLREEADKAGTEAAPPGLEIGREHVLRALAQLTGIPSQLLDDAQSLRLEEVRHFFDSRIIGQGEAVEAVVDLITLLKAGLTDPHKPMGVLLFVGPTGVGKTELAKALAEFVFGSSERLLRYDMSEYKDYTSFEKLIGNPQAPDQSPMRRGSLVSRVRQQPFSVILFDEIEKAHPNIFDLFLQLFDAGRMTDAVGQVTNFTKTVIIMTSNIGSDLARPSTFGFRVDEQAEMEDEISARLKQEFRPEFLNRLDRVVKFTPLDRAQMRIIAQRELGRVLLRSGITRRDMLVDVDPGVIDVLLKHGFSRQYGARPLKRAVERVALLPIARQMVKLGGGPAPRVVRLEPVGDAIQVKIVEQQPRLPPAARVDIAHPYRQRTMKVTLAQLRERAAAIIPRVDMLEAYCRDNLLAENKADLIKSTTLSNFWDAPAEARHVLGAIHRIERVCSAIERVRKRADDLLAHLSSRRVNGAEPSLSKLADQVVDVERDVTMVEYGTHCQGPLEGADAIVSIARVGEEPADDDPVGLLAEMYIRWAHRHGFQSTVLHEVLADEKTTRELAVLLSGVSLYGVLRGESGIHEFIYGKTSKEPKRSVFCSVRIWPALEGAAELPADELECRVESVKGAGKQVPRYRSQVTLTHLPLAITVQTKNGLARQPAIDMCRDYLQARLAARRQQQEAGMADGAVEPVVRKYTLRPTSLAKDQRTGASTNSLRELWNGSLGGFLDAFLSKRVADEQGTQA
ncbi:MAG TPA: AAA family ATPase [Pirellulales bacterium]|nr:AAA family ATPase [Pirellulales bacterium]